MSEKGALPSDGAALPGDYDRRRTVFVFGSNELGIHGAGAALTARRQYGARLGVGEGPTGDAYAIPTKRTPYARRFLAEVRASIQRFLDYAEQHPECDFLVVRVGCGLAGFRDREMAACFAGAPANCRFDPLWQRYGLESWGEKPLAG